MNIKQEIADLQDKLDALRAKVEESATKAPRIEDGWTPLYGEDYRFIASDYQPLTTTNHNDLTDAGRLSIGNVFHPDDTEGIEQYKLKLSFLKRNHPMPENGTWVHYIDGNGVLCVFEWEGKSWQMCAWNTGRTFTTPEARDARLDDFRKANLVGGER